MKKNLLIVGGSHCFAYKNTKSPKDWIAMLDHLEHFDIKVMAIPGTSNLAVKLMLDHYLENHPKPDYVLYQIMPCNRVDIGLEQYNVDINDIAKNKRWITTRIGHRYECGCEFNYNGKEIWTSVIMSDMGKHLATKHPNLKKWIEFAIIHNIFPNKQDYIYPETSMLKLENLGIPYSWFFMDTKFSSRNASKLIKKLNFKHRLNTKSILGESISPNHLSSSENEIMFREVINHLK